MHTCSLAVNQHFSFKVCCLSLRKVSLTHLHGGAPEAGALARRGPCSFQGQCGITGCFHFLRSYPSSKDFQSHVWCGFLTRPLPPPSPCRLILTLMGRANALWFPALPPSQAQRDLRLNVYICPFRGAGGRSCPWAWKAVFSDD